MRSVATTRSQIASVVSRSDSRPHWRGASTTTSITNEAVEYLAVTARDVAYAVIKASDVMVATE